MFGISRDGGIPGLRYETTQDGQPSLAYVRASPGAHYVAISHLWADGLGNPHDNTLPRCQLQSIADQVKACNEILAKNPPISTDHPMNLLAVLRSKAEKLFAKFEDHPTDFWLDVYCVPLLPPGDTDDELYLDDRPGRDPGFTREVIQRLKSIALQRMYETYAWARCTLVLDRELMSIPRPSTLSERWARIALCAWNTRFWTFQEYCLAPQTFFQFEDGPWLKEFLVPWQYEGQVASNFDVLNNAWAMNLWRMSKPERTYMGAKRDGDSVGGNDTGAEPMTSSAEIFTSVWNCLNLRSTTKAEDVAMICANLMYLNATELSSLGPKDLMKAIVAAQEVLPLHILSFDANRHDPRAADVVPFGRYDGWVPVSPVQSQKLEQGPVYLKVLDSGLELRRTGNAMIEGQIFEVESPESHAWSFDDNAATVWVRPPLSFQIPAGQKVLVVFQRNIGELPQNSRRQRRGFCLLKGVEMGGHLHASYLCPVNWGVRGHNTIHEPQQLRHCAAKRVAVHSGHIIIDCGRSSLKYPDYQQLKWPLNRYRRLASRLAQPPQHPQTPHQHRAPHVHLTYHHRHRMVGPDALPCQHGMEGLEEHRWRCCVRPGRLLPQRRPGNTGHHVPSTLRHRNPQLCIPDSGYIRHRTPPAVVGMRGAVVAKVEPWLQYTPVLGSPSHAVGLAQCAQILASAASPGRQQTNTVARQRCRAWRSQPAETSQDGGGFINWGRDLCA